MSLYSIISRLGSVRRQLEGVFECPKGAKSRLEVDRLIDPVWKTIDLELKVDVLYGGDSALSEVSRGSMPQDYGLQIGVDVL